MRARPFRQPSEFTPQADTAAMARKPRAKHVRHVNELRTFTNRTLAHDRNTDSPSRSDELRVRVAYVAAVEYPVAVVGQHRRACQSIVDMALGVSGGGWWYTKHSTLIVGRKRPDKPLAVRSGR